MKIGSARGLLFVAIVTSAVVAQIRVHTISSRAGDTAAQTRASQQPARTLPCDAAHSGMLRAACETMRSDQRNSDNDSDRDSNDRLINRADTARSTRLWV